MEADRFHDTCQVIQETKHGTLLDVGCQEMLRPRKYGFVLQK
jgi:hypothetical protein